MTPQVILMALIMTSRSPRRNPPADADGQPADTTSTCLCLINVEVDHQGLLSTRYSSVT
jgi:hypothetical protein